MTIVKIIVRVYYQNSRLPGASTKNASWRLHGAGGCWQCPFTRLTERKDPTAFRNQTGISVNKVLPPQNCANIHRPGSSAGFNQSMRRAKQFLEVFQPPEIALGLIWGALCLNSLYFSSVSVFSTSFSTCIS
jgi:hypothetical protein